MTNRPNIFTHATKELSQDAFVAWLASWAQSDLASVDAELHRAGRGLVDALLEKAHHEPPESYSTIRVFPQDGKIDVLLLVNGRWAVVIEDKTDSKPHSGQLARYLQYVREEYEGLLPIPIYLKTGEPTPYELRQVADAEYFTFLRSDLLSVVVGVETTNAILLDFRDHLKAIDHSIREYVTKPTGEWHPHGYEWSGFFAALAARLHDANWSYVPNASGGFMGLWWHTKAWRDHQVYLQLENDKLCFKVEVEDKSDQSGVRDAWHKHLMTTARDPGFQIKRPNRFGRGRWMTTAVREGDYRAVAGGRLDMDGTLAVLQQAERFLDQALASAVDI